MLVFSGAEPLSQVEAAARLGIDRTMMVSLIDGLEDHGLVERRRGPRDRRSNIVELTPADEERLRQAERARRAAERRFLAALDEQTVSMLVRALQALVLDARTME